MSLLPRKSALAIAAVTDVALNAHMGALSGKALHQRRGLGTLGRAKIAQGNKVILGEAAQNSGKGLADSLE
jgi:hypothetical protein